MKNTQRQKDYLDHYTDWQNNQNNPGHFTGSRTPIWLSRPGKPKLLGIIFFIFGLAYSAWTVYEIIQVFQREPSFGEILSIVFLSIPSIVLLAAGMALIKRSHRP